MSAPLRAPTAPEIFVGGDAAAAHTGDGHWTLQSCERAGQLGRVAGENAARDLLGLSPMPYTQPRYVACLDLGRSGAVFTHGWERRVEKTGAEAKAVKQLINTQVIYPPAVGTAEALLASLVFGLEGTPAGIRDLNNEHGEITTSRGRSNFDISGVYQLVASLRERGGLDPQFLRQLR